MKGLKLFISVVAAFALLAMPGAALAKRSHSHGHMSAKMAKRFHKWERRFHLGTAASVAHKDADRDGLSNLSEFVHGTNPLKADTDNDGVGDDQEIEDHTNPDDASSNDATEISGTVTSFDGTTLVIQLPGDGAGTVTGTVNQQTEVECNNENENEDNNTTTPTASASEDGSGDSGSTSSGDGDNSGSGSTTSGSDDGQTQTTSGSGDDNTSTTTPTSGDDNNAGDDNDDQGENDQQQNCTIAVGDIVHEAKFVQADGGNVFTKVELSK